MLGIEDQVVISPNSWPARATVAPGDLSQYAPLGLGMAAPLVMQPWDRLEDVLGRGSFYGANDRSGDPIRDAPINDATGGVIYFDSGADPAQLASLFSLLRISLEISDYAVFAAESKDSARERYLAQIRVITFGAMKLFGAVPDSGEKPWTQPLTIRGLIDAFIGAQQTIWGRGMSSEISGTLGGDGDWAREKLAFGFMVENASNGVYRLWSRPWLVTK